MENTTLSEGSSESLAKTHDSAIEKRKILYRVKINTPVILKTEAFKSETINAQTVNLGEGGLGIALDSEVELPSPLLIEFSLMNTPIQFHGEVRWNKIFDDGKYYCGVHFLDENKEQESILKRFLYTNDEYIQQLIENLPETEKENSCKIEHFFKSDVKGFVENLIRLEEEIKDNLRSEDSILNELTTISEEILKKGDELEEIIKNWQSIEKIKDAFRSLVGYWVYQSKIVKMSLKESYGYSGNCITQETIYNNQSISDGLGIYYDKYFLNNPYAIAVQNRKEKMKDLLMDFLKKTEPSSINILNLASGPCREIRELLPDLHSINKNIKFTCVDFDENAISFSKEKLMPLPENIKVEFLKENILRLIAHKDATLMLNKQNLIYSMGLVDYLSDAILKRTIFFAFSLLNNGGKLIITHKDRDKYKPLDPDWFCDWSFEPRNVDGLIRLINNSGIRDFTIELDWEDSNKILFLTLTKRV
ncbi:MAG: PilZ domain-containing protein [Nitrospirota bacterium]